MGNCKQLFRGVFNYNRQVIILYRWAYSLSQAREVMFRTLSRKHNVSLYWVRGLFDGSKDNFEIKIETEFEEIKDEREKSVNGIP